MEKHCHALRAFSVVSVKVMYSMAVIMSTVMLVCTDLIGYISKFSFDGLQPFQIVRIIP